MPIWCLGSLESPSGANHFESRPSTGHFVVPQREARHCIIRATFGWEDLRIIGSYFLTSSWSFTTKTHIWQWTDALYPLDSNSFSDGVFASCLSRFWRFLISQLFKLCQRFVLTKPNNGLFPNFGDGFVPSCRFEMEPLNVAPVSPLRQLFPYFLVKAVPSCFPICWLFHSDCFMVIVSRW